MNIPTSIQINRLFDVDWVGWNITRWSPNGDYNISLIADLIHRVPHFDVKLRQVNGTFDPYNNEYLESLGIVVALPGFWLIVTLLFFLIFFLCRCCDANSKKKKSLGCCKCCLFMFTILSVTIVSVGILGNLRAHEGIVKIQNHTASLASTVDLLRNETNNVENTLESRVDEDLNKISRKLIGPLVRNYTVLNFLQEQLLHMRRNVTKGINRVGEMNSKIERLDLQYIPRTVDHIEQIRWPATFAILGSLGFFCFLLLCGVCRHSRCLLILFSVLGLLSLVICWVLAAMYVGILLAATDFCYEPKPFLSKQFSNMVESQIVNYYLDCDVRSNAAHYSGPTNNPFRKQLRDIRKSLDGFEEGLFRTTDVCEYYCPDTEIKLTLKDLKAEAKKTQDAVTLLTRVSECHDVHMDFLWTMSATCKETLEGVTLMLVSAAATGLSFTLLVLCASHTWINIRKKRPLGNDPTDEADPFLPPASATSTATSTGSNKRIRDSYISAQGSGRPRYPSFDYLTLSSLPRNVTPTHARNEQPSNTLTRTKVERTYVTPSIPNRFTHTPPQTPHYTTSQPPPSHAPPLTPGQRAMMSAAGHRQHHDPQLAFVAPPPSYDQLGHHIGHAGYHQGHHMQQQQQQQHHQVHYGVS